MDNQSNISSELLNRARNSLKGGNTSEARLLLEQVLGKDPDNAEAYYLLANVFHQAGEIGKAIKAFNKVLSLDDGHTDAAIGLSVLYNDIGRYDEAKKVFDTASERVKHKSNGPMIDDQHINRKFSHKHFELAELYMTYGRFDEALFEYNKAVQLDPENLGPRVKVAKVYAKKGFIAKAFDELKKLKNEHPEYVPARIALGILYYGNGNIIEAQTEWERVLSKDPGNHEAAMYLNLSRTATETTLGGQAQ